MLNICLQMHQAMHLLQFHCSLTQHYFAGGKSQHGKSAAADPACLQVQVDVFNFCLQTAQRHAFLYRKCSAVTGCCCNLEVHLACKMKHVWHALMRNVHNEAERSASLRVWF